MQTTNDPIQQFEQRFQTRPAIIISAPGRINLIGGHTDYNDGFVLPMAIDHSINIAASPLDEPVLRLYSENMDDQFELDLTNIEKGEPGWQDYVKAAAWAAAEHGMPIHGWQGLIRSNIPIGAGLSSSAAFLLAILRGFAHFGGHPWEPMQAAQLAHKAETQWVGLNCGIMDQLVIAAARKGQVCLIDCRSLEMQFAPLAKKAAVVIMDTDSRRGLLDSAYNQRVEETGRAAKVLGVPSLRDASLDLLEAKKAEMDEMVYKRAKHVVHENLRVLQAFEAVKMGDLSKLGEMMTAAHHSLAELYEVSNFQLDKMVELALLQDACYGARMTGAGFGGCAVALVERDAAQDFAEAVSERYSYETGLDPQMYISPACGGVSVEKI